MITSGKFMIFYIEGHSNNQSDYRNIIIDPFRLVWIFFKNVSVQLCFLTSVFAFSDVKSTLLGLSLNLFSRNCILFRMSLLRPYSENCAQIRHKLKMGYCLILVQIHEYFVFSKELHQVPKYPENSSIDQIRWNCCKFLIIMYCEMGS